MHLAVLLIVALLVTLLVGYTMLKSQQAQARVPVRYQTVRRYRRRH